MKRLICFIVIGFFTMSGLCFAQHYYSMAGSEMGSLAIPGGKWWRMSKIAKDLELTSEEQTKLDVLFMENRRQMIDLKAGAEKAKLELEEVLDKKDFDESVCMERFTEFQDADKKLAAERFKFLVEVRKLLGTERFQKIKTQFHKRRMNLRQMQNQQKVMKGEKRK
jgi:Spy/CpxP family protein refolding chaperone